MPCTSITNNSIKYQLFAYTQLNIQTVLFLTVQFSISQLHSVWMPNISIRPIDRNLSGATTPGQKNNSVGYSTFPKFHHQIVLCHTRKLVEGEGLTPLQGCSRCILQPRRIGMTLVGIDQLTVWMSNIVL